MAEAAAVTYSSLSLDEPRAHASFEAALGPAEAALGHRHTLRLATGRQNGVSVVAVHSPLDRDLLVGEFAQASVSDVERAVATASTFASPWNDTPWTERVSLLRGAADLLEERRFFLAATLALEVGKARLEALADVGEAVAFLRYYCDEMVRHQGFAATRTRAGSEETSNLLLPYGVWAVIAPFNFPIALAAGPVAAALLTGNSVILKPASAASLSALLLADALFTAGLPARALQVVTGSGGEAGQVLAGHPLVAGVTFTGSASVGMGIYRSLPTGRPRPVICEMGGKNPVIVGSGADLDSAAEGTLRSAFGFGGQKCSAASRAYVLREEYDGFVGRLVARTAALPVGDPRDRTTFLGPLIDQAAVARYESAVAEAGNRGRVLVGGERVVAGPLGRGNYVLPTVVEAPEDSWVWRRELFAPVLAVAPVDSLDEALVRANDTEYGLTAGFYGTDHAEIERFLDSIDAGVVYVNRRAGATTGAWPGIQAFGGWKASGTSGRGAGGPDYLPQYLREQSRTVIAA
jgi:1-pyrroline-5-carboxylate dehydrogenase